jgi:hypothetical protein
MTPVEAPRMPKVTLYVKEADEPIWDRARQLAGDSLSSIVSRALAAYVEEQETRAKAQTEMQRAAETVTLLVEPHDRPTRKVRFTGVLAHESNAGGTHAYVTTSGKVVLAHYDRAMLLSVEVFDTYQEFLASEPTGDIAAAVAETMGEEWIEDID